MRPSGQFHTSDPGDATKKPFCAPLSDYICDRGFHSKRE